MYPIIKRGMDILIAGIVLILISPLMIPVMIILRFTAEGLVFYSQKRVGYKNKMFDIHKFVTMIKGSSKMLNGSLTVKNDPRVTPVGKYLRMTKINELPQVFNVIKGDMSIVGPRPQMEVDFKAYPLEIQKTIYDVKPGITGIGSIIFRDEQKIITESELGARECYERVIAPYKGEVEIWYQKNASLYVDIMIILITAWVIIFPQSRIYYKIFKTLPRQPEALAVYI